MLEIVSLTKRFGGTLAIDDVSFVLRPGTVLGCIGANGAGKSTTVKIIVGLQQATSGTVHLDSREISGDMRDLQRRMGYVPEDQQVYGWLTGAEHLELVGRLRGLTDSVLRRRSSVLLRLIGLQDAKSVRIDAYSKGMRQKLLLCAALIHNPDILVLDEPYSGLDYRSEVLLNLLVAQLASQRKMVLYCSHSLQSVIDLCHELVVLRSGRIAHRESFDGSHRTTPAALSNLLIDERAADDLSDAAEEMTDCITS